MRRIVADPTKCLGCRTCEFACALAHVDTDDLVEAILELGARPRIYIESAGEFAVPLGCRHCEDAPCVVVCPTGALSRPGDTGPVLVNQEKCIGCAFCVEACPFGVVVLSDASGRDASDSRKVVIKCDLCQERVALSLEPACVWACPVGALSFEEVDQNAKRARRRAAAQAVAANLADGKG